LILTLILIVRRKQRNVSNRRKWKEKDKKTRQKRKKERKKNSKTNMNVRRGKI